MFLIRGKKTRVALNCSNFNFPIVYLCGSNESALFGQRPREHPHDLEFLLNVTMSLWALFVRLLHLRERQGPLMQICISSHCKWPTKWTDLMGRRWSSGQYRWRYIRNKNKQAAKVKCKTTCLDFEFWKANGPPAAGIFLIFSLKHAFVFGWRLWVRCSYKKLKYTLRAREIEVIRDMSNKMQ